MPMLLHKLRYVVNLSTEGGGGQNLVKSCLQSLWMAPNHLTLKKQEAVFFVTTQHQGVGMGVNMYLMGFVIWTNTVSRVGTMLVSVHGGGGAITV